MNHDYEQEKTSHPENFEPGYEAEEIIDSTDTYEERDN